MSCEKCKSRHIKKGAVGMEQTEQSGLCTFLQATSSPGSSFVPDSSPSTVGSCLGFLKIFSNATEECSNVVEIAELLFFSLTGYLMKRLRDWPIVLFLNRYAVLPSENSPFSLHKHTHARVKYNTCRVG